MPKVKQVRCCQGVRCKGAKQGSPLKGLLVTPRDKWNDDCYNSL